MDGVYLRRGVWGTTAVFLAVGAGFAGRAAPVEPAVALRAASVFLARSPGFRSTAHTEREPTEYRVAGLRSVRESGRRTGRTLAYAVRLAPFGFILLTADDRLAPVFGYSARSSLDLTPGPHNSLPLVLERVLERRLDIVDPPLRNGRDRVAGGLGRQITAAGREWSELLAAPPERNVRNWAVNIGPLLSTVWGQQYDTQQLSSSACPTFNYYAPEVEFNGDLVHAYSGCIPTAMAQLLKYFSWPAAGSGTHSYIWRHPDTNQEATLSADFAAHTYRWDLMKDDYYRHPFVPTPTSTEAEREAVGRLVYDCGVAVDADFSITGLGTTANLSRAASAFTAYFRYGDAQYRSVGYGDGTEAMLADIRAGLTHELPALAALSALNHVVVLDGFRREQGDTSYLYHVNFGYEGRNNGWYDLTAYYETNQAEGNVVDSNPASDTYDGLFYGPVTECVVSVLPRVQLADPGTEGFGTFSLSWEYPNRPPVQRYELQEAFAAGPLGDARDTLVELGEDAGPLWEVDGNWQSVTVAGRPSDVWWGRPATNVVGQAEILQCARFFVFGVGARLEFDSARSNFWGLQSRIEVSSDDGVSWQAVSVTDGPVADGTVVPETQLSWQHESVALNPDGSLTGKTVALRFAVSVTGGNLIAQNENGSVLFCGWYLDRIAIGGADVFAWTTVSQALTTESYTAAGKPPGSYYYRVRPRIFDQWRTWSNRVDFTVLPTPRYNLLLSAGAGGTTSPAPGTYVHDQDTVVHLTATPDAHHVFSQWVEVGAGRTWPENPLDYTLSADAALTAEFSPKRYSFTVASEYGAPDPPAGSHTSAYGDILSPTCGGSPDTSLPGTKATLTGWTLATPQGELTGTDGAVPEFAVEGDTTLTWHWRTEYTLALETTGPGGISAVGPEGTVDSFPSWFLSGARVAVTAEPDPGWSLTDWTGDLPAGVDPHRRRFIAVMTQPVELTANFEALVDADADGLHDPWELLYWPAIDSPDAAPDADPDGDLLDNLAEYRLGTDPLVPTCRFEPGWNLVAVSRTPAVGATVADQFPQLALPRAWAWDPALQAYKLVAPGEREAAALQPGRGYWVYSRERMFLEPAGLDWGDGKMSLKTGWNLIGPILGGPQPALQDAPASIWRWDRERYHPVLPGDLLHAGYGYWFWSDAPVGIDLP
ncbi:MAG: hypothetical protein GXP31_04995 [Kiritimatiellaeota bacterium]|nr:hypothetical protein [Kiritimatiellota bacterium]